MHPLRRSTPGRCSRLTNPTGSPFRTFRCLLLLGTLRIGEAINPGPTLGDHHLSMEGHWLLSANPTGAAHKAHIYLQPRVTWCLQERHLTSRGTAAFLREVQAQAEHVTPDHRCTQGTPARREGIMLKWANIWEWASSAPAPSGRYQACWLRKRRPPRASRQRPYCSVHTGWKASPFTATPQGTATSTLFNGPSTSWLRQSRPS